MLKQLVKNLGNKLRLAAELMIGVYALGLGLEILGANLNFRVLAMNGGMMPVWGLTEAVRGMLGRDFVHVLLTAQSHWVWACDILPTPSPMFSMQPGHFAFKLSYAIQSLGDVLIDTGTFVRCTGPLYAIYKGIKS